MTIDNFTVNQNTAAVEQANGQMSLAQIDDIERRAKATKTTVEVDSARASEAETKMTGGMGTEAKLYGDIIADAVGLKTVSAAAELLVDRHEDHKKFPGTPTMLKKLNEADRGRAVDIEQDIASANRKPGAYRVETGQRAFGAGITDTPSKPGVSVRTKPTDGEDLMARSNIATMSLKEQHKEAVGSWDVKETKMAGVQLAKKLSFGQEYASELALQSALVARQQYSATVGHAMQMAPGMGMNGPSFKGADIMKMAQEEADLNRWRTQQT